jgi:hypothetical protein
VRRLVNAYAAHLDRLESGDAFDGLRWFLELAGFIALSVALVTVGLYALISWASGPQPHGSCKYQHWAGKTYVCDEYYLLPTTDP